MAATVLSAGWTVTTAQNSMSVGQLSRASKQRQQRQNNPYSRTNTNTAESQSYGTFFIEYNPTTMSSDISGVKNRIYQGVTIGFNYFVPFAGSLGFDAGLKGQYFFRNKKEGSVEYKDNMFSGTVPVDLVYDWQITDGFAIAPYAGVYGRFNFTAKEKEEYGGTRTTIDVFKKDQMGDNTWNRFQFGWQAGVNLRISEMMTIGGGYWMDLNELTDHLKLHGFNITLGTNF